MAAKMETSLLSCAQCSFQTKRSTELTNHTLQTHALAAASRIFESQVSKLMSVDSVVERAGLEPGSLELMFTDKERKRSHVVQVVSSVTRGQDTLLEIFSICSSNVCAKLTQKFWPPLN